jgi:uracil-DNA glycosylase
MDWLKIMGTEWESLLRDFLNSNDMSNIINNIHLERRKHIVYPLRSEFYKMFRIFKELKPSDIHVVILGQDPYPDGTGDGFAFSNSGKLPSQISPSLTNILKEIENNDTEKDLLELDLMDLNRWVKQGVFLANSYLTVRSGSPGLHTFWKPFTINWIKQLSVYNDIIWLMWGKKAQEYIPYINNDSHYIIKTSHPSPLGATKDSIDSPAFIGSKCFELANMELWVKKNILIKW